MSVVLRTTAPEIRCTVVTGATGLLGSLATAAILARSRARVIAPVRAHHTEVSVREGIARRLRELGEAEPDEANSRLTIVPLPERAQFGELVEVCRAVGTEEVVHCAGSVDYFDTSVLDEANVQLTLALLELGKALGHRRFVFVSTAFSSGYAQGLIPERLHPEPPADPTEYTRSKREAEHRVAASGLPWLVVRPSAVIGHSRTGAYDGKPYGPYQFMTLVARLLRGRTTPDLHIVAPHSPVPMVHQDAFQEAFWGAYQHVADGGIVHAVSRRRTLPTMRELFDALLSELGEAAAWERAYVYGTLEDVPLDSLPVATRSFVEASSVNTEIATREWDFATETLDRLRDERGVAFQDATRETFRVCIRAFLEANRAHLRRPPAGRCGTRVIEM